MFTYKKLPVKRVLELCRYIENYKGIYNKNRYRSYVKERNVLICIRVISQWSGKEKNS